jgi:hypothetical protein
MSNGAPAEKFTARLEDLRKAVATEAQTVQTNKPRVWYALDSDSESKHLNVFDEKAFAAAFDRAEVNKAYIDAVQQEDTPYRDMQAAKVQGDVLSALERDLRMRYRGRVRMLSHAEARLQSHGLNNGPINNGIINFVKLLMARSK